MATACGRIGFEPTDGSLPDDVAPDADVMLPRSTVYLKASNTGAGDRFGTSIALSEDGTLLAVGAYEEESNATGVGGNQADNSVAGAGAVYLFGGGNGTWTQRAYLKASNPNVNDQFGFNLAMSGDGRTVAVVAPLEASSATGINGNQANNLAPGAGAVYVFTAQGGVVSQQAYIKASNTDGSDQFGYALALSRDGNTLAVGARQEDSAGTGVGANQADNTATDAGAVYVFTRAGATWTQQAYIKPQVARAGNEFGRSLAVSDDGNTLVVAATYEMSNAIGIDGDQTNQLASAAGSAYVFARSGTTWSQQTYLKASNTNPGDSFGWNVSIAGDGDTIAVGALVEQSAGTGISADQLDNSATEAGAVYVFVRAGATWAQQAYVKAPNTDANDHFGWATALTRDGNELVVSATGEASAATGIGGNQADNTAATAGAAYVYVRAGGQWTFASYLKATNTGGGDDFGKDLAVATDTGAIAIGASAEDSATSGVGGDGSSNAAMTSGAAYVFE